VRYWIFTATCGDWWWDRLEGKVKEATLEKVHDKMHAAQPLFCFLLGHAPIPDCANPLHDHCAYCSASMPGKANRFNGQRATP
jgi:hypothetical protein